METPLPQSWNHSNAEQAVENAVVNIIDLEQFHKFTYTQPDEYAEEKIEVGEDLSHNEDPRSQIFAYQKDDDSGKLVKQQ